MQVPIIPDTWESLEEKVALLAREQGKNILAADIVSSGDSARMAGLIVRDTLLQVEYALYTNMTSLTDRRLIYQMFQNSGTMIGIYGKKEFQAFFWKLFGWSLNMRKEAFDILEKEVIRNYKQYIENKVPLGRYEDPIDIKLGVSLIEREISFLRDLFYEERIMYY